MVVYWTNSFMCVNHNYDEIFKADWLSTVLISALIDFDFTSVHNYAKRTWPMTSHIGQTLFNNVLTHVQYTQTDTIRETDGPLVPMVRLVPMEKHPIPMAPLVNMHLIKET